MTACNILGHTIGVRTGGVSKLIKIKQWTKYFAALFEPNSDDQVACKGK